MPTPHQPTDEAKALCVLVREHYFCSSGYRCARLLMSIHNGRTSVNFFHDLNGFDFTVQRLTAAVVQQFLLAYSLRSQGLPYYEDGDFNEIANWLIDDAGYLDDVAIKDREEWIQHNGRTLATRHPLERDRLSYDSEDASAYEDFETFSRRIWLEEAYRQ